MFEVELQAASIMRASGPCKSEGEAPAVERREPASAGTSASLGRGIELGYQRTLRGLPRPQKRILPPPFNRDQELEN